MTKELQNAFVLLVSQEMIALTVSIQTYVSTSAEKT